MRILRISYIKRWCCHEAAQPAHGLCPGNISPDDRYSAQRKYSHRGHRSPLSWKGCRSAQEVSGTLLSHQEAWCRRQYRSSDSLPSRFRWYNRGRYTRLEASGACGTSWICHHIFSAGRTLAYPWYRQKSYGLAGCLWYNQTRTWTSVSEPFLFWSLHYEGSHRSSWYGQ